MNNKYVNRSKISEAKFRELVRLFSMDLTAIQISKLSGLNRNTVNRYLKGIRERIAEFCAVTAPIPLSNRKHEYEKSELPDRKLIGISEQERSVYTGILKQAEVNIFRDFMAGNEKKRYGPTSSMKIFEMLIEPETGQRIYLCDRTHHLSNPSKYRRMEGFWGHARSRLEKFKGLHNSTYLLHLKECEFRYNHNQDELYSLVLKIIRNKPLF